jgi:hypothetical protein
MQGAVFRAVLGWIPISPPYGDAQLVITRGTAEEMTEVESRASGHWGPLPVCTERRAIPPRLLGAFLYLT